MPAVKIADHVTSQVTTVLPVQISTTWQHFCGPAPAGLAYAAVSLGTPIGGMR
jgi:hypothetical protein